MNFYQCEISGENYIGFITYALRTSDKFSFFIPHLNELSPEEKQFRDDVKGRLELDPAAEAENEAALNGEVQGYLREMRKRTAALAGDILKTDRSYSYLGYGYGHLCESYWVSAAGSSAKAFLLSENNIFAWRYPYAPEDLAFFRGDTVWCRTVAHEKTIFFTGISEQEAALIQGQWIVTKAEEDA